MGLNPSQAQLPSYLRVLVGLALAVGLWLRLIGLSYAPYDDHNFRQCQTLSTIETFFSQGIDLLHPKTLYMGDPGILVLELPLFQALAALLYHVFGPHLEVVRLLNIAIGAATVWLLYRLTAYLLDRATAMLSVVIYWLAPLNISFQRSMLLDPLAVFCGLLSFYCLARLVDAGSHQETGNRRHVRLWFIAFAIATWLAALIKALYLWPAVLLLAYGFWKQRFRPNARLLQIVLVLAVSGVCFLAWNRYSRSVNDASPFTRGTTPTSLLGFSALLHLDFYRIMFLRAPKWWLGAAVFLYPVGLWAWWVQRDDRPRANILLLLILVPPTYLLAFANINKPHDYYQLIITPFLSIAVANGVRWLALRFLPAAAPEPLDRRAAPSEPALRSAFGVGGPSSTLTWARNRQVAASAAMAAFFLAAWFTYSVWLRWPAMDPRIKTFEQLCAGKFEPWATAMVFMAPGKNHYAVGSYVPGWQYAAKLWGYGMTVENAADARKLFDELAPAFHRLEYVLFYGTECPDWLPPDRFRPMIQDTTAGFYVFQRVRAD